jgi:phosphohistidine phosphatase
MGAKVGRSGACWQDKKHIALRHMHRIAKIECTLFFGERMRLFLVRHGDADAEVPEGLDDAARPLTSRGRLALLPHFMTVAAHLGTPSVVYMSPLVRAVQTATLLAHALGYDGPLRTHRALFPDGPVGALEALVEGQQGTVVLVGHQPSMGSGAAHFLGLPSFPRTVTPGTVVGIERDKESRLILYAPIGQPLQTSL